MDLLNELKDITTQLPRGGYLVQTSIGYLQFGSPTETIKDTMSLPQGVPQVFVVPSEFFSLDSGINVADLEFPIYYNFFLKKRKTFIVCNKAQAIRVQRALQESLFGPKTINLDSEFEDKSKIPDLKKEFSFFRGSFGFNDVIGFSIFNNNYCRIQDVVIKINDNGEYDVYDKGEKIALIPDHVHYKATYKVGERLIEPYHPPLLGMTTLGRSHGFDQTENSSGFLMWINHNGIMIDPPVNSTEWLKDSNVNPKLIDSIILTHCHADHDAGTFQKILQEGKIVIYTTNTIMQSFLRKYSALINKPISYLKQLFQFQSIKIGTPIIIHGASFKFNYSLHSIPTIGFNVDFQGKTIAYSSDHLNKPDTFKELLDKGIISQTRYEELLNFNWNADYIFHEAGIPPLHTPLKFLSNLDENIRKKLIIYHIAKKDFLPDNPVELAKLGIEGTLYIDIPNPQFEKTYELLGVLKHLDFSRDFPLSKAQDFISIIQEENFAAGDKIVEKNTVGDRFFIIYSGNVSIRSNDLNKKKVYGNYEYFGEISLITGALRTADVYAETNVVAYTIAKDKFFSFIDDTEFEKTLTRLTQNRNAELVNLLSETKFFEYFTSYQKTWLESIFTPMKIAGPHILYTEGSEIPYMAIIKAGEVEVFKEKKLIKILKRGDYFGSFYKLSQFNAKLTLNKQKEFLSEHEFVIANELELFVIKESDIRDFIAKNPGVALKLQKDF
jgi:CRP-like cAMP-binding protein/phosphoribosyl 1,2-cyclic phosphodiesterase